jgi:hypothetical protein
MKDTILRSVMSIAMILPVGLVDACAAHFATVDGYEAEYVDAPVNIETYPRYEFQDGYVYNVNGRYYHNHGGRWVAYRHEPPGIHRR